MIFTPKFFYDIAAGENGGGEGFKPKTKEQADFLNNLRVQAGEAPIPFEDETSPVKKVIDGLVELSAEEKLAKEVEDKKIKDAEIAATAKLAETNTDTEDEDVIKIVSKTAKAKAEEKEKVVVTTEDTDIDEAIILKQLSKKLGREITSLDDLKPAAKIETPEDVAAKAQERENAKLSFGLQNKKITNKEVEAFIADSGNHKAVAYDYFALQQKELDPTVTDKDIKERFEFKYSLNEDEDTLEYKQGQKDLNFVANTIIKERHKNFLNLENEYSSHEKIIADKEIYNQKILSQAPAYKALVEKAALSIKSIEAPFGDKIYKLELPEEAIAGYVNHMLTAEYSEKIIANGMDENLIVSGMRSAAIADNLDIILESYGQKILKDNQKGLRGIEPAKDKRPAGSTEFLSKQQKAEEELNKRLSVQNQSN